MAPPLSVIKMLSIVASVEGVSKILQKIMSRPLFVIKIVKYCGVGEGGGGIGCAKILQKIIVTRLSEHF